VENGTDNPKIRHLTKSEGAKGKGKDSLLLNHWSNRDSPIAKDHEEKK